MMTTARILVICAVTLWAAPQLPAAGQSTPPPAPCSQPEFRQFDFWAGSWDLSWPASATTGGKPGRGTNRIEKTLDGCVVVEHFDGTPGSPLRGMSVSTYDARARKWRQTWVDNQGSYLDFTGSFEGGRMTLAREATSPAGQAFLQRMVWTNITRDSLDWRWERSDDGGKTWTTMWPVRYMRKGSPAGVEHDSPLADQQPPPRLVIARFFKAYGARDVDALTQLFADDIAFADPTFRLQATGRDQLREMALTTRASFTDFAVDVHSLTADGDSIAAEVTVSGALKRPDGTTRPLRVRGASFFRVRHGRIEKWTDYFDFRTYREQVGAP